MLHKSQLLVLVISSKSYAIRKFMLDFVLRLAYHADMDDRHPTTGKSRKGNTMKYESIIRKIAVYSANRQKKLAKHHMKRILPYYDQMTDLEKEVVDELRLKIFC